MLVKKRLHQINTFQITPSVDECLAILSFFLLLLYVVQGLSENKLESDSVEI